MLDKDKLESWINKRLQIIAEELDNEIEVETTIANMARQRELSLVLYNLKSGHFDGGFR